MLQCVNCCCTSCQHGSSFCHFPRFDGEDIGDETRNFVAYVVGAGFLLFLLSYVLSANTGCPRIFVIVPSMAVAATVVHFGTAMQWLVCKPQSEPIDNEANWKKFDIQESEMGLWFLRVFGAVVAAQFGDFFASIFCCGAPDDDEADGKPSSPAEQPQHKPKVE
jgi:hypothetical protein